jgi:hypothetical protein
MDEFSINLDLLNPTQDALQIKGLSPKITGRWPDGSKCSNKKSSEPCGTSMGDRGPDNYHVGPSAARFRRVIPLPSNYASGRDSIPLQKSCSLNHHS